MGARPSFSEAKVVPQTADSNDRRTDMRRSLSESSGIPEAVRQIRPHDHVCLIHEAREKQSAAAVHFIRAGLKGGEKCFYIAPKNAATKALDAMKAQGV